MSLKKMGGLLSFCLVGILVSGCGSGKPSDKDGEKI